MAGKAARPAPANRTPRRSGTQAPAPTGQQQRPTADAPPPPTGEATGTGGSAPARLRSYRWPTTSGPADDAAGFILGLLVWGWVIMPFVQNGTKGVRDTLRAKFVNKGPDGSWLP